MSTRLVDTSSGPDSAGLEFSNFFDGVGLPTEWSPDFQAPEPEEEELLDPLLREPVGPSGQGGIPFGCWMPPTPQESRLPEVGPANRKPTVQNTKRRLVADKLNYSGWTQ
jgi:hypothetical protein